MSYKTWKAEYYTKAADLVSKEDALAHSIQKWKGLSKAALKRHGLRAGSGVIYSGNEEVGIVSAQTCALCVHYLHQATNCWRCPLSIANKGMACDDQYNTFVWNDDNRPMLRLLRKAQNMLR